MGLRAKNKSERQSRILKAAARLFRKKTYDAVKIEEIADAAEVSIGTIYNYYQNKGDVLVAIVNMEVTEVLAAGEKVVAQPPRDGLRAVNALVEIYIGHSLFYLSKEMWRRAMAISTEQPESPFGRHYAALDGALTRQVCALMGKLKGMALLTPDADTESLGEIVFNNTNMMFINFVKDEQIAATELQSHLRRQHKAVLRPFLAGRPTDVRESATRAAEARLRSPG